jgi:hypothetical protein
MKTIAIAKNHAILNLTCLGILTLWLAFPGVSNAQTSYTIGGKPVMSLKGSSTLHKWAMTAHAFTGDANFSLSAHHKLSAMNGLSLRLPVHNLKCESAGMEKSAYKALKANKYKDIVFELTSAKVTSSGSNKYRIVAQGNLTIAGVTQPTTLDASAMVHTDGTISCSGSAPVYLKDYNIDPPTFMLGTMKVADLTTLTYSLLFVQ